MSDQEGELRMDEGAKPTLRSDLKLGFRTLLAVSAGFALFIFVARATFDLSPMTRWPILLIPAVCALSLIVRLYRRAQGKANGRDHR
jgi:hypothetical protein